MYLREDNASRAGQKWFCGVGCRLGKGCVRVRVRPVYDSVLVQEVQALRHGQRRVLTALMPVELMGPLQRVPAQRLVQIATLQCGVWGQLMTPTPNNLLV